MEAITHIYSHSQKGKNETAIPIGLDAMSNIKDWFDILYNTIGVAQVSGEELTFTPGEAGTEDYKNSSLYALWNYLQEKGLANVGSFEVDENGNLREESGYFKTLREYMTTNVSVSAIDIGQYNFKVVNNEVRYQ